MLKDNLVDISEDGLITIYVTFGQKYLDEAHPLYPKANPDGWVEFLGETEKDIYAEIDKRLSFNYAFSYKEEDFTKEYFPLGCLDRFECPKAQEKPPTSGPAPKEMLEGLEEESQENGLIADRKNLEEEDSLEESQEEDLLGKSLGNPNLKENLLEEIGGFLKEGDVPTDLSSIETILKKANLGDIDKLIQYQLKPPFSSYKLTFGYKAGLREVKLTLLLEEEVTLVAKDQNYVSSLARVLQDLEVVLGKIN